MRARPLRRLRLRRRWLLALLAAPFVLFGAAYAYLAFQTSHAPAPAHLGAAPVAGHLSKVDSRVGGRWRLLETGSFVGYRMREKLGLVPAPNDAVGRTTAVHGSMLVSGDRITQASVTADVRQLKSDQPPRDGNVNQQALEVDRFPTARFRLTQPIPLRGLRPGEIVELLAPGEVTIHGITKRVGFPLKARWNGPTFQVAGQLSILRSDFRLELDQQLGLRVSNRGKIEVELTFARAAAATAPRSSPLVRQTGGGTSKAEPAAKGSGRLVVAVQAHGKPGGTLFAVGVDGTQPIRITRPVAQPATHSTDVDPSISPDGGEIAFARVLDYELGEPPPPALFVVKPDGSGLRRLTSDAVGPAHSPAWSPNGRLIAYVKDFADGSTIWVIRPDGTGARKVTSDPATPDDSPSWSPDSKRLVFASFSSKGNDDLFVVNADGSRQRRLTAGPAYDLAPSWSPDGRRVAFSRDGDIYVIDVSTSGLTRLTSGPARDSWPKWSRDGARVAFVRADEGTDSFGGPPRVLVMRADGTDVARVRIPGEASAPDWVP